MMETALNELVASSFAKFTNYLYSFIPVSVEIKSISEVVNYYADGTIVSSLERSEEKTLKEPLF